MKEFIKKHQTWIVVMMISLCSAVLGSALVPLILISNSNSIIVISMQVIIPCIIISAFISYPVVKLYKMIIFENEKIIGMLKKDHLTGMLNRQSFFEEYGYAYRCSNQKQTTIALILIDIDDFKLVNDTYGHLVGDNVIRAVGQIIAENAPQNSLTCRFGGEEFLVMMQSGSRECVVQFAEKILHLVPYVEGCIDGIRVSVSVGIAFSILCQTNYMELIRLADQQMYQAKTSGKGKACITVCD